MHIFLLKYWKNYFFVCKRFDSISYHFEASPQKLSTILELLVHYSTTNNFHREILLASGAHNWKINVVNTRGMEKCAHILRTHIQYQINQTTPKTAFKITDLEVVKYDFV